MGDGGFGMTISELSTAVEYGINTTTIVMNNQSWGAEKAYQKQFIQAIWWEFRGGLFINRKGRDLSKPIHDFVVKDYRVMWSRTSVPQAVNTITPRRYKNKWVCVFYDKNDRMLREITSGWVVVTHTVFDPEMKNRTVIDIQHRSKLSDPREARLER